MHQGKQFGGTRFFPQEESSLSIPGGAARFVPAKIPAFRVTLASPRKPHKFRPRKVSPMRARAFRVSINPSERAIRRVTVIPFAAACSLALERRDAARRVL